jgi:acylphosphatase
MEENKVRAHAIIHGRVQGVFFRAETQRAARQLGVLGWVRNRFDGTVEAIMEGDESRVHATLKWCERGPRLARVEKVEVDWEPYQGEFDAFSIRY